MASAIFRCSATTSPSCRRSRRSSTAPDLQLDGFLGPGHCRMVIGTTPYEFIAQPLSQADGHRRLRAAGRAAVDLDGAASRSPRVAAKWRTNTRASSPRRGNAAALARHRDSLRAARVLRMARPGIDRPFRRPVPRSLCAIRRRATLRRAQCRRSPTRRHASAARC